MAHVAAAAATRVDGESFTVCCPKSCFNLARSVSRTAGLPVFLFCVLEWVLDTQTVEAKSARITCGHCRVNQAFTKKYSTFGCCHLLNNNASCRARRGPAS